MEGIISGVERDGDARGAVYRHSVSAVGSDEGLAEAEDGEGGSDGCGECGVWIGGGGGGGGVHDAVGCGEDEVDVGEGESGDREVVEGDMEGGRCGGFLEGSWAEGFVDFGWGSHFLGELSMGV